MTESEKHNKGTNIVWLLPPYRVDEKQLRADVAESAERMLRNIATMQRVLRNDKPRGVLPSSITARPHSRGVLSLLD